MSMGSIGLFLTRKCNLNCIYCCFETGPDPSDKLTLAELKNVVRQAKELGARWVMIPGYGEPLLDDDLLPLLEYATSLSLRCKIYTNGSLIDNATAAWLFRRRVSVVFKLNSLDERLERRLSGNDVLHRWVSYRPGNKAKSKAVRIPEGLKHLLDAGYAGHRPNVLSESLLQITGIAIRPTLRCLPRVARFCRAIGLDLMAETIIPIGPALANRDLLSVSPEEERRLYQALCSTMGWRFWLQQRVRCRFETNPFIDLQGDIRSCFSLAANIGNIREAPLAELHCREQELRRKLGLFSPRFRLVRSGFRYCASRRFYGSRNGSPREPCQPGPAGGYS